MKANIINNSLVRIEPAAAAVVAEPERDAQHNNNNDKY